MVYLPYLHLVDYGKVMEIDQSHGWYGIWGFHKWWYPQIIHFNRVFQYKPSTLGYPYFWKQPYTGYTTSSKVFKGLTL